MFVCMILWKVEIALFRLTSGCFDSAEADGRCDGTMKVWLFLQLSKYVNVCMYVMLLIIFYTLEKTFAITTVCRIINFLLKKLMYFTCFASKIDYRE